ncbi:hypothetical protein ACF0H5_019842 [Mactra antiquata]
MPDLSECNLKKECDQYYQENIVVKEYKRKAIELETRGQSFNEQWKQERKKRLTSSVFGEVINRSVKNNSPALTKRLLYTNFGGNCFTRKGIMEEENARKEYANFRKKKKSVVSHIVVPGLKVSLSYPHLATSSDGIVYECDGSVGLIEIKHYYKESIEQTSVRKRTKRTENLHAVQIYEAAKSTRSSQPDTSTCTSPGTTVWKQQPQSSPLEPQPSTSTACPQSTSTVLQTELTTIESNRKKARKKSKKFIGRRISHKWENDDGSEE